MEILTFFILMCIAKAKARRSSNFISGLIQPRISTPIPSFGTHKESCKLDTCAPISKSNITKFFSFFLANVFFLICISFYVDGSPIREFKNMESIGVPFPRYQPMTIYSTLWNAGDWATRGGLVKTDWSQAPFTASYTSFNASNACVWINGASSCDTNNFSPPAWLSEDLDSTNLDKLQWVQKNNMIYNYCTDAKRFPQGFPPECNMS